MRSEAITILLTITLPACATAQTGSAWTDNYNQPRDPLVAEEVRPFIIKRQGCDHFRGEPPYDAERQKFLTEQIQSLCTGTDAELKRLRVKYANHPETIAALSEFEDCIEFDTVCANKE